MSKFIKIYDCDGREMTFELKSADKVDELVNLIMNRVVCDKNEDIFELAKILKYNKIDLNKTEEIKLNELVAIYEKDHLLSGISRNFNKVGTKISVIASYIPKISTSIFNTKKYNSSNYKYNVANTGRAKFYTWK
jgi:hypothetical protein